VQRTVAQLGEGLALLVLDDADLALPAQVRWFTESVWRVRPELRVILICERMPRAQDLAEPPNGTDWRTFEMKGLSDVEVERLLSAVFPTTDASFHELVLATKGNALATLVAMDLGRGGDEVRSVLRRLTEQRIPTLLGADGRPLDADSDAAVDAIRRVRAINGALLQRLASDPDAMYRLTPYQFEEVMAELYAREGYDVELTRASRDGGVDLYVIRRMPVGRLVTIVDCKHHARDRPVGVGLVRQLYGVVEAEDASAGVIATTSLFTRGARAFEAEKSFRLGLLDYIDVQEMLLQNAASGAGTVGIAERTRHSPWRPAEQSQ
jgi:restriction system protein